MYLQKELEDLFHNNEEALAKLPGINQQCILLDEMLDPYDVHVKRGYNRALKQPIVYGLYDYSTDEPWVIIKKDKRNNDPVTAKDLPYFLFFINSTVQHELIHRHQYLYRDFDIHGPHVYRKKGQNLTSSQTYFSNADEIEAHAHDLAMQIRYHYPHEDPGKVLNGYFKHSRKYNKLYTLNQYVGSFRTYTPNSVMRRLITKTWLWLNTVEVQYPQQQ